MEGYELVNDINTMFKPGEDVQLADSFSESKPTVYQVNKIIIDSSFDCAVRYYLTPQPKGGAEWYYSNQLRKI